MAISTPAPARAQTFEGLLDPGRWLFAGLNLIGLAAYLAPFFAPGLREDGAETFAHRTDAPIVFAAMAALCLVLVVADLTAGGLNSNCRAVISSLCVSMYSRKASTVCLTRSVASAL